MLSAQTQAPDFSLPDENGNIFTLSQHKNETIVLYFYPKDDTPGCTIEACSFRDMYAEFDKQGILLFGIGKGSAKDHKKFKEKFHLQFPLLVDDGLKVSQIYQVLNEKSMFGKSYDSIARTTFLIKDGMVVKIWEHVNPIAHASEVLENAH